MNIDHIIEKARELLTKTASGPQLDTPEALAQSVLQAIIEGPDGWSVNVERLKRLLGDRAVTDPTKDFGLVWSGRAEAMEAHRVPTYTSLRPVEARSVNFETTENLYIEGDNLRALKLLLPKYHDRVKVIYIDPPYNTGKDFIYPDDFRDFSLKTNTVKSADKLEANLETSSFYHSKWLSMMWPRLKLAKEFLTEDGVIFISIDDHEVANLRLLCDEIFGAENFVGQWNWVRTTTAPNLSKKIKKNVEYILAYERKLSPIRYRGIKKTSKSSNGLLNQDNKFAVLTFPANVVKTGLGDGIYKAGAYGTDSYKINLLTDVEVKDGVFVSEFSLQAKFKWGQEKLLSEIKNGTTIAIRTITFSPSYEKQEYLPEVPPNLIDENVGVTTTENAGDALVKLFNGLRVFDYPKPVSLIKYLYNFVGEKDDIVMDFFSGSATTAHAAMELNAQDGGTRKFIMVQVQEPTPEGSLAREAGYNTICDIGEERIRLAGKALLEKYPALDVGFRTLEVAEPLLNEVCKKPVSEWAEADASIFDAEPLKPNVTAKDLLFYALMQSAVPLTAALRQETIGGLEVWCAYEGALLRLVAYVQDVVNTLPVEQAKWMAFVEALAKRVPMPENLFIPQACFSGGSACQINVQKALEPTGITLWTL